MTEKRKNNLASCMLNDKEEPESMKKSVVASFISASCRDLTPAVYMR